MKKIIVLLVALLVTSSVTFAQLKGGKTDTTKHATIYNCPMHPEVTGHEAGKCPKCGMSLALSNKEKMKTDGSKNYACPVHVEMQSHNPGKCPKCGKKMGLSAKEQMKMETTKLYTCPMHPTVSLDKEGKCPKCGTSLVEKKKQ